MSDSTVRPAQISFIVILAPPGSPDTRMRARPLDARQPLRPDQAPTSMAGGAAASGVRLAGRGGLLRQDALVGPGNPEAGFLLPVGDDHFDGPHAPYSAMILAFAGLRVESPMEVYQPLLSAGI